ncbi:MAG: hypothetical protein K2G37_01390 [Clostridia bacterium]|nr:hypothetical protein [Clostridia bacterium]MDE7329058.1 hypothetical protein [Clostridia bacterium]
MNIESRRKATSIVVSLLLIAVIAVTGVLCAVTLKSNTNNDADVNLEKVATYSDYGMEAVSYDSTNSALAGIYLNKDDYLWVYFPTKISLDKSETLASAGYYYNFIGHYGGGGDSDYKQILFQSVMGYYGSSTAGLPSSNSNMTTYFTNFNSVASVPNGAKKNLALTDNYGDNKGNIVSFEGGYYDNSQYHVLCKLEGTPYTDGSSSILGEAQTFSRASGSTIYIGQKWNGKWIGGAFDTVYADQTSFTSDCSATKPVNYFNYSSSATALPSDIPVLSDISITINVYDKSGLYEAKNNLQTSLNELSSVATNASDAEPLIEQAEKLLKKRDTDQDEIKALEKKLNEFVFIVPQIATSYLGWTYGASGHTDKTYLESIVSSNLKYNASVAKFFTVTIDRELASEWSNAVASDATKTINDATSYTNNGYVHDAGTYTIKFTPKGILHTIEWSSGNSDTITTTLTISRATATVTPPSFDAARYNGSEQSFAFAANSNTITLQGGMTASTDNCTVNLSKENLTTATNPSWNDCGNSVRFTEVGKHRIYYRIEIKNHFGVGGVSTSYFEIEISKADIEITFSSPNAIITTYGDDVLDASALAGYVSSGKINGGLLVSGMNSGNVLNTWGPLSNLFSLGLCVDGAYPIDTNDNLTPVGTYPVLVYKYADITNRSDVLVAENANVTNWGDRLNVTFVNNNYEIERKAITLDWTYDLTTAYDALAHAPTAAVASGELVEGGEEFTPIVKVSAIDTPLKDGNAIWAGAYTASVENTTDNYDISNPDCGFEINKRELYLSVADKTAGYAQYMGDSASSFVKASEVLEDYRDKYERDVTGVFSFVDCAMAGSDSPLDVFTVDIINVAKTGDYYDAGTHNGALTLRLLTAQDDANANLNLINSYELKDVDGGTFDIAFANITTTVQEVRLTYNGENQEFTLSPTDFTLSGYEQENKATTVTIKYAGSATGPFESATRISLKDYSQNPTFVYYEVSAKNHNTQTLSFEAYIDKLEIEFTVNAQDSATNPVYYGDDIPTSNELRQHLSITYVATNNDGSLSDYSIDGILGLYLTKAGVRVERNATAGLYDLSVESLNSSVSLDNFTFNFVDADGNAGGDKNAFEISKRPLVVDWRQDSWEDGGITFTYSAYSLTIYPTVRRFRSADIDYYKTHTTGEGTSGAPGLDHNNNMYVENYVSGDVISLKEHFLGMDVGEYPCATELTKRYNIDNYYLVNPTMTFKIVPRNVAIKIYDQETTYGNVSNVLLGNLSTNKFRWNYYSDTADKFMSDKHSAYWKLSVEGLSNTTDAGEYDIVLSVDTASDTTGITNNYNVVVYRQKANGEVIESTPDEAAKLTINQATFTLKQSSFDIDGSPRDEDGTYVPEEYCNIDANVIREIIRLVGATKPEDVAVYLTEYYESYPAGEPAEGDWSDSRTVSINDEDQLGTYYIYIKLENKNYGKFTAVIAIHRYSNWISITLDGGITAIYGDKLLSSDELFAALRDQVSEIIGVMDDAGQITNAQEAWDAIEERGYFSLNVNNNTDLNTILEVGFYSIFIDIDEAAGDLHFRFKVAENGTQPSNVDIYEITKRPVYLIWAEDAKTEYEYGEYLDITSYCTMANLVGDDAIIFNLEAAVDNSNGNPGNLEEACVGDYIAYIDENSIVHDNYRIAIVGVDKKPDGSFVSESDLTFKFSIIARVITITFDKYDEESGEKLDNLTLTYGDLDARQANISAFLNSSNVYSIVGGDLGEFTVSEVFEIKLKDDISSYDYLPANGYAITVDGKNKNFNVHYEEATLVVKNADFIISNLEFERAYYNGNDIKPDIVDATLDFGFIVDTDQHDDILIQNEDGNWVSLKDFTLKNAGIYKLNVKVEADNYNPSYREVEFTIEKADVTISLSSFEKEYGQILGEGDFATVVSDHIKTAGAAQYLVKSNGETITIDGISDVFIFYVVAGGAIGVNGGDSVENGNYANSVGSYRIYHSFVNDVERGNFNVTYANDCNVGAYVITPARVDVEWFVGEDKVTSGDEFIFTGSMLDWAARYETVYFEDGEMKSGYETLSIKGDDGIDVDTYTASAIFASATSNYTLNSDTSSFTYVITKRTVYVAIGTQQIEFGSTKSEILSSFDNTEWVVSGYYDADGWSMSKEYLTEFLAENNAIDLTLDLSAFGDDEYVPVTENAYNIIGSNSYSNFEVVFSDETQSGSRYGIFTVSRATMVYDGNATYSVTYDGTAQEIDFFEALEGHVTLKGGIEWTRENVDIIYTDHPDGELPTIISGTKKIAFDIKVANHGNLSANITVTVRKAQVVLMITTTEFTYGSTDLTSEELCQAMNISINKEAGDPINVDLYDVFDFSVDAVNVGSYALNIAIKDESLKDFIEATLDINTEEEQFIVVPKTVGVDWGNTKLTYNGNDQLFESVGFIGEVNDVKITAPTYSIINEKGGESGAFAKNVGNYDVKISINAVANPNYVIDEDDEIVTFEIVAKEVQVEWKEENFVYDGEAHTLTAEVIGGVIDGDELNLTYSAGVYSAGPHTASIVSLGNDNYAVSEEAATKEFTIQPKVVELTWEIKNFVYNAQVQCPKAFVSANSLVGNDVCEVVVSGGGVNAGNHTATAVELKNANYALPTNVTYKFAIAQLQLSSIIWTNTSLEYKENNGFGVAQAPSATGVGMLPGDSVELEISGAGTDAGSYRATVVGVSNSNYTVGSSTANATVGFQIVQADNEFEKELVLPESEGGLPSLEDFETVASKYGKATVKYYTDEACTQEYTGNLSDAGKGTYYVVVEVEGNANYKGCRQTFTVAVSGNGSNAGLIVGIVLAVVALLAVGAVVIVIVLKKKKKSPNDEEDED